MRGSSEVRGQATVCRLAGWVALSALALAGCAPAERADLVIENVRVYGGEDPGGELATVAVRDGRFSYVGSAGEAPAFEAGRTLDGAGRFLTPGLWDVHVHLRSSEGAGLATGDFLAHGITSVRDLGGYVDRLTELQQQIEEGAHARPAIYPAYFMLNGESFAGFQQVVTNEDEVDTEVDRLAAAGATQIKVHRALPPELLPAVVNAAARHDLEVVGHIPLGMHPLQACEQGMAGVEHIGSFVEALVSVTESEAQGIQANVEAMDWLMSPDAEPLFECLVRRKVAVAPTLVIYRAIARRRVGGDDLPPHFVRFIEKTQAIAERFHRKGVVLLAGTDTTDLEGMEIPAGSSLHEELGMLEDAGIPPLEVLAMATGNPGRVIDRRPDAGRIVVGAPADFLLLSEDPAQSVRSLAAIDGVFRGGRQAVPGQVGS
ncbi:hypothetical protein ABI59_06600 [Acidobacteria bacterium Mor1]|nr:hypothetical protein ABI59_06600 [Acidobacteria bacterium Mor1]